MIFPTGLAGLTLNDAGTGYGAGWADGAPAPSGIDVSNVARAGFYSAAGDKTQAPYSFAVRIYPMQGASMSLAAFHTTVKGTLRANRSGAPVMIEALWDDLTPVEMSVVIVSRQRVTVRDAGIPGNVCYDVVVRADVPVWLSQAAHSSSGTPITNAGTDPVYPSVAFTSATHKTWRRVHITHTTPLEAYPVLLTLSGAVLISGSPKIYVYVNGWSQPFVVQSATTLWTLVNVTPGYETIVDVVYGSGLAVNPDQGALDMGGLDEANSTNTAWRWTTFEARSNQGFAGQWRADNFSDHTGATAHWTLGDTGTDADTISLGTTGDDDADALVLSLPSGGSGTLAGGWLTRSWSAAVQATPFIAYRLRNNPTWVYVWQQVITTLASSSSNVAVTFPAGTVEIAFGVKFTDPTSAGTFTFDLVGTQAMALTVVSPTITVDAAVNLDYYSGVYRIGAAGAPALTFVDFMVPDGTLTIDTLLGQITSSVADAPMFGSVTPSDPAVLLEFLPGAQAVANTTGGTATVSWQDGYGIQ